VIFNIFVGRLFAALHQLQANTDITITAATFNRKRTISHITLSFQLLRRNTNRAAVCSYSFGFPELPQNNRNP